MIKKIVTSIIIWFSTTILTKLFDKFSGVLMLKDIYNSFVIEIWPIYIGIIGVIIYWVYLLIKGNIFFKNWVLYHSSNYERQEFDNLEEKINYLIDVRLNHHNEINHKSK